MNITEKKINYILLIILIITGLCFFIKKNITNKKKIKKNI